MILRASLLCTVSLAAAAGCETVPPIVADTDAGTVVTDDLGPTPVSASCAAFGDGGTLRAQGSWRVVAYESEDPATGSDAGLRDGGLDAAARVTLTRYTAEGERVVDPANGNASVLRVNGALQVTANSVRLALGLLRDDRFAITAPASPYVSTYDGSGVLTAMERRFVAPNAMVGFEFCAGDGGRIVARTVGGATRRILLEPDVAPVVRSLPVTLRVRAVGRAMGAALRTPRTAVVWEVAGRAGLLESLGAAAAMQGDAYQRPLEAVAPQGDTTTARFAVGHPVLYDDLDGDGRFDPARDALRSVSSLALAWRDPDAPLDGDRLANRLRRGMQVVALHVDAATAATVPVPLDPVNPVPLECAATEAPTGALPDVVR